jgi:CheY-like chemotaxis protein
MAAGESGAYESGVTSWNSELQLLLVEGDPGFAERYKLKLELDGYVVRVACGRAAAMAALAQSLPDLVFLDVRPSVLDGSEILHDIRTSKETRYLPVVVLSNDSKDELVRRGLQLAGGEWVIQSPGRPAAAKPAAY